MSKLAKMITHFYIRKKVIDESEREVYYYCYEMLLSTIINCCAVIALMFVTKLYIETICFSVSFIFLRRFAGGYHSKTHFGCLSLLIISYIVMWAMITFGNINTLRILSIIFVVFSIITIFVFAPLNSINNPLDNKSKIEKIVKILIVLLAAISTLFVGIQQILVYGFVISYSCALVSLSVIIGKIQYKLKEMAKCHCKADFM